MSSNHNTKGHLMILGPYPPPYGGVAIFNQNLFEAFKENENLQIWAHTKDPNRIEKVAFYKPNFINTIRFLIKNSSNKTIIDSSIFSAEYPEAGVILAWAFLKPFLNFNWIKVFHDGTLPSRYHSFNLLQKLAIRISIASYDQLLPVSQELSFWLNKTFQSKNKIRQISSLLPIPKVTIEPPTSPDVKKDFPPTTKLVCSIGAFTPNYGFKQISDAVNTIRIKENRDIALILIAGTFKEDSAYKERTLKKREWIKVLYDIPHQKVLNILKASDVFVRATREESYGICKVEAILCGTPVLATPFGETRGMHLCNSLDKQQMIDQLKEVLDKGKSPDHLKYIDIYQMEAKQNIKSILNVIKKFA